MKKVTIFAILTVFVLALSAVAMAEDGMDHSKHKGEKAMAPKVFDSPQDAGTKATCPVTGSEFTIDEKTVHSQYKGKHVYFCCEGCKPQFDADPEKYLNKK